MTESRLTRQPDVFCDRQVKENIADLKGARETHLRNQMRGQTGDLFPFKEDLSLGGRKSACDEVKESGFSCPILTDDRSELPLFKRSVQAGDDCEPSKVLMKVLDLQDGRIS